jgi:predicted lipoprotein with Yx(FWY)xxD motif
MKRTHLMPLAVLASAAIAAPLAAAAAAQPSAHASRAAKIQLRRTTSLGKILVDTAGFTVYRFGKDSGKRNTCVASRACSAAWPALTTSGSPTAGPGVNASLLSTIRLANGSRQVTYAGHPLYRYAATSERAETSYAGVEQFGGKWYAVNSAGRNVK